MPSTRDEVAAQREQLFVLSCFLEACEDAAKPPRSPSGLGLCRDYPETLREMLELKVPGLKDPPFQSTERLTNDRAQRIGQLERWLHQFPAFNWLRRQPAIRAAQKTFARIQKRRKDDPKFSDDLSPFRFWSLAVWAIFVRDTRDLPPPRADQRKKAVAAAAYLSKLAADTTLLTQAGIGYKEQGTLLAALERLQSLAIVARRQRTDDHSADRYYVERLARWAVLEFGDAPPALVCELAALRVRNPDKAAIARLVSKYKRARASKE